MGNFIAELKRRKVLRVAIAYIVVSWVLLQVADVMISLLELPSWTGKLVLLLLLIGFAPALILAWAFDLTPDGVKAAEEMPGPPVSARNTLLAGISLVVIVVGVAAGGYWYMGKDVRWARNVAMHEIENLVRVDDLEQAFELARRVEEILPGDPDMTEIWNSFAWTTTLLSTPAGATVYRRPYEDPEAEWMELGVTPLNDIRIPHTASVLRIEADGYRPLYRVIGGGLVATTELSFEEWPSADFANVHPDRFRLDSAATLPEGMVRVPRWELLLDGEIVQFEEFFLGKFEVTNREFQAFVDAGGYGRHDLWEHDFVKDGQELSFDEAMEHFVDSTGRPGPSTWAAGTYAEGRGDYPVAGVSWYEAEAYARFAGYELPTIHHWRRATAIAIMAWQLPASNLNGDGLAPVGAYPGMGWTGTWDMAGNVREWCRNETADGMRAIVGSAWNDDPYLFEEHMLSPHRRDPFDRSPVNGLRIAKTQDPPQIAEKAARPVADASIPDIPEPVSDDVYSAMLSDYGYDRVPLNAVVEETQEFRHWTRERVTIDAPGGGRMPIYIYLPHRTTSRHTAIVEWGGATSQVVDSIDKERFRLGYVVRNGRAVVIPVLKGQYDRRVTPKPDWSTHAGRDLAIEEVREFRRTIDYLATRPDIDMDKLAYYGHSWGGRMGAQVMALEPRLKIGVLNQAGINHAVHADIHAVNFLPRVTAPILHFSGLYDTDFPIETSSNPFHEMLGTDPAHKKHVVERTGHFVPYNVVAAEVLDWLDKYLGPVE